MIVVFEDKKDTLLSELFQYSFNKFDFLKIRNGMFDHISLFIFTGIPLQSHNLGVKCVQKTNFKTGIYIVQNYTIM